MSTSTKLSASQKGLAPILIILLIAAAGIGGYFIYQNQTKPIPPSLTTQSSSTPSAINLQSTSSAETANWKTYTDTEGNFSFKYPTDWAIITCEGISNTIFLNPAKVSTCKTSSHDIIGRRDVLIQDPSFFTEETSGISVKSRKIILDGKEAYQADIDTSNGKPVLEYTPIFKYTKTQVKVEGGIFSLSGRNEYDYVKTVYDQILSTFRFD